MDMMETETSTPKKVVTCSAVKIKDPEGCYYLSDYVFSLAMQSPSGVRCGFVLFSLAGLAQSSPIFVDSSQSVLRQETRARML